MIIIKWIFLRIGPKKKFIILASNLQNTKFIHVLQFGSSFLALIYRSRWWRHSLSSPPQPNDTASRPKDTNPWHTQIPIMHSCVPSSSCGSPKHDYRVGLFSGAWRLCLLSVIMHTFVFDAFIQGAITDTDCYTRVVAREVSCVVEDW
jgi:hypothetical protein